MDLLSGNEVFRITRTAASGIYLLAWHGYRS